MLGIRDGAGRESRFSVEIILSHSTEAFPRGTLLCFRKFGVSKNFMPKREISPFSIENLLSHSTEKLRRGTLLCFTKFLISKKIMDKRGGGGREYHDFLSKIFCLTVPKNFVEEPVCAVLQKISSSEKVYGIEGEEGGSIKIFRQNCFLSQCQKIL